MDRFLGCSTSSTKTVAGTADYRQRTKDSVTTPATKQGSNGNSGVSGIDPDLLHRDCCFSDGEKLMLSWSSIR